MNTGTIIQGSVSCQLQTWLVMKFTWDLVQQHRYTFPRAVPGCATAQYRWLAVLKLLKLSLPSAAMKSIAAQRTCWLSHWVADPTNYRKIWFSASQALLEDNVIPKSFQPRAWLVATTIFPSGKASATWQEYLKSLCIRVYVKDFVLKRILFWSIRRNQTTGTTYKELQVTKDTLQCWHATEMS